MSRAVALLGPTGPLASRFEGYEHRPGQLEMTSAVERALDEDRIVLCEAGTGTGKTLAYLVPALLSGRKIIISTAKKALQEQIVLRDLPLVERLLGLRADALIVKGLGNYLCLRRFDELRRAGLDIDGANSRDARVHQALPLVERWAARTATGDLAELAELEESHPIWREAASGSDTRIGSSCAYYADCHVTRLRRAAERAQIVVCNHHLLFADLALRDEGGRGREATQSFVLPPHDALIIDEAHQIADIATSFFGVEVSSDRLERLAVDAERAFRKPGRVSGGPSLLERLRAHGRTLFASLSRAAGSEGRSPLRPERFPHDAYHALDDALEALAGAASTEAGSDVGQIGVRALRLRGELGELAAPRGAQVGWVERRGQSGIAFGASPIDVGPWLRERLFERGAAVVLTSATLAVGGSFAHTRRALGLDEGIATPIDELCLPPAFDYPTRALLYTPLDLPEVTSDDFPDAAGKRIAELVAVTGGGAFVLTTSLRTMRLFARTLTELGHAPLVQGQAPKRALLDRFRAAGDAILCATMSFWEGVDVPGRALRLVVIDRIPFAVPTDPLVQARAKALEEQGLAPFKHDALPQAATVLKQGFGRLLRTRDDYGIVAVLDRRLRTKGYGKTLIASLPPAGTTSELADVVAFFERLHGPR